MNSSSDANPRRALLLFLKEPSPGLVHQAIAKEIGDDDALFYYQAQLKVLLTQLAGIEQTTLRIHYAPDDAGDAIRFFILPLLEGRVKMIDEGSSYAYHPNNASPSHRIEFFPQEGETQELRLSHARSQALNDNFKTVAMMGSNALECGARWINMAMMLCEKSQKPLHGESPNQGIYLSVVPSASTEENSENKLPSLRKIQRLSDWEHMLETPLGAKLKKELNKLKGGDASSA